MKRGTWKICITFGRLEIDITESAVSEQCAIDAALRYARAMGYSGHPTTIRSRRLPC